MGKSTAKAPAIPDPSGIAASQTQSNIDTAKATAQLNNVNQKNPWGTVNYTQKAGPGGVPTWTQTTSLSPILQQIFNRGTQAQATTATTAQQAAGRAQTALTDPMAAPTLATLGTNDFSADRQRVEDALMGRLTPQVDRDKAALDTNLINRGIRVGSQAHRDAMREFDTSVAEHRTSAVLNAAQEQSRLRNLEMATTGFNNTVAQQGFGNDLTRRNQLLNEAMALVSGSQISQPGFQPTNQTGVAGTDVAGIQMGAYNAANNQYQQQQAQNQSLMGGLFSLGSSALMAFSDKRLKEDIEPTGEKIADVPVVQYRWKDTGRSGVGVIAQEVEKKHPELVDHTHPSGMRRVNYGGLMRLGATAAAKMKRAA